MEELGVSGFNSGTAVVKKRRSTTSRRPRPDSQLLLAGCDPSPPSSTPSSDIGSKQSTDGSSGHDASVRRKEDKSDDDPLLQDIGDAFQGVPWKDFSEGSFTSASKESSIQGKPADDIMSRKQIDKAQSTTAFEPVRKSKRVPKRRVLHDAFDDVEDDESRYLERLKTTKLNSDHGAQHDIGGSEGNKKQKTSKVSKRASYEVDGDFSLSRRSEEGKKKSRSDQEPDDMDYVEDEEAGSDVSESRSKKQRKEPLDSLSDSRREFTLTTRQRALQSGQDGSGGNSTSLIEFPNGLPPAPPTKQKGKPSEVEQQLKKAEAAQRRRLLVEKAARESEAEAIRKILGQDSNRKKREEKLQKKREELAQEKAAKTMELAANAVRWVMGPSGTIVTFPESIGVPSIFYSKPCSFPVRNPVILLRGRNVQDPPVPILTNTGIRSLTYLCAASSATGAVQQIVQP